MRKKLLILFLITNLSNTSFSNNFYTENNKTESSTVNENDDNWEHMINAIIHVESKGNEKIISKNGIHHGILQISPIIVKDCNRILGKNKFKLEDRLNKEKSIEMFNIIQNYYNPNKNIEKAIRLWNGGHKYSISKTQIYYNKVIKHYYNIKNNY